MATPTPWAASSANSVGRWGPLHKIYLILADMDIIAFHIYDIIVKDRLGNLMRHLYDSIDSENLALRLALNDGATRSDQLQNRPLDSAKHGRVTTFFERK